MNWIECLQSMIDVMENHLQTPLEESQIYAGLPYSAAHLRKGFSIVAGYSPIEYLRSRRLACAGQTLWNEPDQKILDVALKASAARSNGFTTPPRWKSASIKRARVCFFAFKSESASKEETQ